MQTIGRTTLTQVQGHGQVSAAPTRRRGQGSATVSEPNKQQPEHSPHAEAVPYTEHDQPPLQTLRHGRAVAILATVAAGIILLDQVAKEWATKALDENGPVKLLGGTLYLSLTRNSGAAFSLFRDKTFIFPLITLVVLGWIGWMARQLRSLPWAISLGLVLGGAFGNLLDRIFRAPSPFQGHVVDFLSLFDPYGQIWPIFNVADMSLVVGVIMAIGLEMLGRHRDGSRLVKSAGPARPARNGDSGTDGHPVHSRADQMSDQ
jgi:signal peptidase II